MPKLTIVFCLTSPVLPPPSLANMLALLLSIATLASAYADPGPCTGDCWTHDPSMIQRDSDSLYFRFATGTGINTMTSPSLEGPWEDVGAALPNGSIIQLDGVDSMDIWVCEEYLNLDQKSAENQLTQ